VPLVVALPDLDVERLRDYCQAKVPDHVLQQIRVELDLSPGAATVVEIRAPWREDYGPEWTRMPIGGSSRSSEVPPAMTHQSVEGSAAAVPADLVRLWCEVEAPEDLVEDLAPALAAVALPTAASL
jgi:hypothetical protein